MSSLALFAITHQRASLDVLEKVSVDRPGAQALADRILELSGNDEVVVVSTCNRLELYLAGDAPDLPGTARALAAQCGTPVAALTSVAHTLTGDAVAEHLFRVAAGLESRLVGESQILGQIRAAIARAQADGVAGPHLGTLFQFATAAGRRARRAPDAAGVPSLARIALDAAAPDLAGWPARVLVVGAGAMAAAVTQELVYRGMDFVVCARRPGPATRLAGRGSRVLPMEDLPGGLDHVDVAICATAARTPILTRAGLAATMSARPRRPLVVVDLGLPRNVEPEARLLPGVHLLDLDDLTGDHGELLLRRRANVVADEQRRYQLWRAGQAGGELIAELRDEVLARSRRAVADRLGPQAGAAAVERAARHRAGRLLHAPTLAIKERIADGDRPGALAVLAALRADVEWLRAAESA